MPDPRGLLGTYNGVLIVEDFEATPPTNDTDHVIVSFRGGTDSSYQHRFDSLFAETDIPNICDVDRGTWTIVDSKISLVVEATGSGTVCNQGLIPEGTSFGFRPLSVEELGDSLIVTQTKTSGPENTVTRITRFHLTLSQKL